MVTGGFRSVAGMEAALASGALDVVGLGRLLAIDPDAPKALLQGRNSPHQVRPIKTGINLVDRAGVMDVLWYELQMHRVAAGGNSRPNESAILSLLKAILKTGWGIFKTRRARPSAMKSKASRPQLPLATSNAGETQ
jgi:hypothetical protein